MVTMLHYKGEQKGKAEDQWKQRERSLKGYEDRRKQVHDETVKRDTEHATRVRTAKQEGGQCWNSQTSKKSGWACEAFSKKSSMAWRRWTDKEGKDEWTKAKKKDEEQRKEMDNNNGKQSRVGHEDGWSPGMLPILTRQRDEYSGPDFYRINLH